MVKTSAGLCDLSDTRMESFPDSSQLTVFHLHLPLALFFHMCLSLCPGCLLYKRTLVTGLGTALVTSS